MSIFTIQATADTHQPSSNVLCGTEIATTAPFVCFSACRQVPEHNPTAMDPALARIWNIAELSEMILLHLPLHDLLLSKRVSKAWMDVHEGSHKIQVALYLRAYRNYTLRLGQRRPQVLAGSNQSGNSNEETWIPSTNPSLAVPPPIVNPFLKQFLHKDDIRESNYYKATVRLKSDSFVNGVDPESEDLLFPAPQWLEKFHEEPSSSWRRMVFTQPAISSYHARCSKQQQTFKRADGVVAEDVHGLKIGTVHKLLFNHLYHCVSCPGYCDETSRWDWHGSQDTDWVDIDRALGITGWGMFRKIRESSGV